MLIRDSYFMVFFKESCFINLHIIGLFIIKNPKQENHCSNHSIDRDILLTNFTALFVQRFSYHFCRTIKLWHLSSFFLSQEHPAQNNWRRSGSQHSCFKTVFSTSPSDVSKYLISLITFQFLTSIIFMQHLTLRISSQYLTVHHDMEHPMEEEKFPLQWIWPTYFLRPIF